jgi:hypothetical protein
MVIATLYLPSTTFACACGCSVFSVGARWIMRISTGYRISLVYDFMD